MDILFISLQNAPSVVSHKNLAAPLSCRNDGPHHHYGVQSQMAISGGFPQRLVCGSGRAQKEKLRMPAGAEQQYRAAPRLGPKRAGRLKGS
jgi:hypothetical protein